MNLSEKFKGMPLAEQFTFPPFSILDTRKTEWIKRKRAWLEITGIPGGGPVKIWNENKTKFKWEYVDDKMKSDPLLWSGLKNRTGKSYFDPVLCEIAFLWFTSKGASIIDPFAGNSISGIVAAKMGRKFTGIDLRESLCDENNKIATRLQLNEQVKWECGDSEDKLSTLDQCDFIFSCPPYGDLEVYSKDSRDLSNMPYEMFLLKYGKIILSACERLRSNRFAAVLVGDFRNKNGFLRNFVSHTISAFEKAGLMLYNEMVLINVAGSLPSRAAFPFIRSRKIGKQHQNFLVFVKGCPIKATEFCGHIDEKINIENQINEISYEL